MKDIKKFINTQILSKNAQILSKNLPPNTKFCAVVKSNAYGHGLNTVCSCIDSYVDCFAVANNHEAVQIKHKFPNKKVLVLGNLSTNYLRSAIKMGVTFCISNISEINILEHFASKLNLNADFHLKLNTGMNRLGVKTVAEVQKIWGSLSNYRHLNLSGIFSHIGDGKNKKRTQKQLKTFQKLTAFCPSYIQKHLASSIFCDYPDLCFDMVRAGISLYGYAKNTTPCLQINARILEIQNIQKGEYIGYGSRHKAKKSGKIAILAIGYSDGLPRLWAKNGYVLVNGKQANFCADICMNMCLVDITNIDADINDYAVILGKSGDKQITAKDIARACKTIPYEILTNFKKIT